MTVIECSWNEIFAVIEGRIFSREYPAQLTLSRIFFRACLFVMLLLIFAVDRIINFIISRNFTTRLLPFHPLIFFHCIFFKLRNNNEPQERSFSCSSLYKHRFFDIDLLFNLFRYIMKCRCCFFELFYGGGRLYFWENFQIFNE